MTHEEIWQEIKGELGDAIMMHKDYPWGGAIMWSGEKWDAKPFIVDAYSDHMQHKIQVDFSGNFFARDSGMCIYSIGMGSIEDATIAYMSLLAKLDGLDGQAVVNMRNGELYAWPSTVPE